MTASIGRVVILSDTHLGKPGGRGAGSAEALRPLWRGADELILNGDTAEVTDAGCRVEAARQVVRLQELCDEDGVRLTLVSGNHDPLITDTRYLHLLGGEVFVTHGDALHPAISPWTGHAKDLERLHEDMFASLDRDAMRGIDGRLGASQHASAIQWDRFVEHPDDFPPRWRKPFNAGCKIARVFWYWHTLPRRATDFADRFAPRCRFFVFGHIHRAGIWEFNGRVIINTGAYEFPARPRGVVIDGGELAVCRIERDGGSYRFAAPPLRRWAVSVESRYPVEQTEAA